MSQQIESVGFVVTPEEIENRIAALDKSIQALEADVKASRAAKLDKKWRESFDSFMRRWAVERDSYATWGSRLFATRVMPRLDAFETSYRWWAADYQKRTSSAPSVPAARPSEGLAAGIPTELWLLVGAAVLLPVLLGRK